MRRLLPFVLIALAACQAKRAGTPAGERPPNIVFIMVDDLGSADLGCYGSELIETPRLDRMAAEGIRFTQFYSGAPVCAPARCTLMTGKHAGHTPVRGNTGGIPLPTGTTTLAGLLQNAGYATGGFGKWGLGEVGTEGVPEKHGFDLFFGNYHQIHAHYFYTDHLWRNSQRVGIDTNKGHYQGNPGEGPWRDERILTRAPRVYTQDLVVGETLEFIRRHRDEPFFVYAAWNPPHGRFEIPASDPAWPVYADKNWPMKSRVAAAMTTMVDRQVGEVLDLLAELGLEENTLVVFCSDNGGYTAIEGPLNRNGDLRGQKGELYEGGLRVPFIARWPGQIPSGASADRPTYFPDMLPTLLDAAGAIETVPRDTDGISFLSLMLGYTGLPGHEYLYWEHTPYEWGSGHYRESGPMQAARDGRWKAVRQHTGAPIELYDLANDPAEQHDIALQNVDIVNRFEGYFRASHTDAPPQIEPERVDGKPYR